MILEVGTGQLFMTLIKCCTLTERMHELFVDSRILPSQQEYDSSSTWQCENEDIPRRRHGKLNDMTW